VGRGQTARKERALDATFVALLRGVNVGPANRLPMTALAAAYCRAGATQVETLIQSGNVVYKAPHDAGEAIAANAQADIERDFGIAALAIVREGKRWGALIAANPFIAARAEAEQLHLACLAHTPSAEAIAALDANRSLPDAFVILGGEIYLHLPNGAARSKLTNAWFDARLATTSTMRNWRTVLRLAEMVAARGR